VDAIRRNNGEGEHAEKAAEHLVSIYYDDAMRATGKYLAHLDEYIIQEQLNNCMMIAALKCPETKPLAGYFIETLKNKLYDISFRIRKKNVIYDYDVFQATEADIVNLFDHKKIKLLNKSKKHVYFYESDLSELKEEEKNYLALFSQIPCTNKIAARRMGESESTVSRIRKRIKDKLMPAYIRNRRRQQSWSIDEENTDIEGEFRAGAAEDLMDTYYPDDREAGREVSGAAIGDILADKGLGVDSARYLKSDDDDDFNTPGEDRITKKRMNLPEK